MTGSKERKKLRLKCRDRSCNWIPAKDRWPLRFGLGAALSDVIIGRFALGHINALPLRCSPVAREDELITLIPNGVVLLAAGKGSRLAELTGATHKSLLPMAGRPALALAIEAVLSAGCRDVVCVTGYKSTEMDAFLSGYGDRVRSVHNARFEEDVNVLSADLGVDALHRPELGYLIVETDVIVEAAGWRRILSVDPDGASFWVTRGRYSKSLTGGALSADQAGRVTELVYAPKHQARFDGWYKLLGMAYVGVAEVVSDKGLRKSAISKTIKQYYMTPWVENIDLLPSNVRDLGDAFASSYNDRSDYLSANENYRQLIESK